MVRGEGFFGGHVPPLDRGGGAGFGGDDGTPFLEKRSSRLGPFFCRIGQAYFPPSHLPNSCRNSLEISPHWAWSLVNTVFVSATTLFNTIILLAVVFLWLVNRQFHFKNRHSYDKKPLRPLKKPARALKKAKKSFKNAAKRLRKRKGGSDQIAEDAAAKEAPKLAEQNNYKSFQTFLDHFEEDDDVIENSLAGVEKTEGERPPAPETRAKRKRTRDLLRLASKIEVFSYLSPEALADILEYVEYVDFENVGDSVFDAGNFDGSMYAVIAGEVTTSLSIGNETQSNGLGRDDDSNPDFSFLAGPGEVITSMLTIITSLIREFQLQDALLHSPIPGLSGGETGGYDILGSNKFVIPTGMNMRAIITEPNTRLLRIPSRCFVAILEKFPRDVYNITQTIVARLERVTIQTLVRFLGLDAGLVGIGDLGVASSTAGPITQRKPAYTSIEWEKMEQSLLGDSSTLPKTSSIIEKATIAAASLLGCKGSSQELKEGASIVHAPAGSIVCSKGERPDAIYLILTGSIEVELEKSVNVNAHADVAAPHGTHNGEHKKAKRTKTPSLEKLPIVDGDQNSSFKPLLRLAPGNWCGIFSCFTHDASFITARVPEDAQSGAMLLKIPGNTFDKVVSTHPRALIHCLLNIIDTIGDGASLCVSPAMFLLDMGLDWMHVEAGEFISIRDEPCDSMFVVLNGRLRTESLEGDLKSQSNHEEYARGDTIGEVEALAEGNWAHSVYAIRHCEVARIPSRIINILMRLFPSSGLHFAKVIASQLHSRKGLGGPMERHNSLLPSHALSLATIAVVPLSEALDASDFCSYLAQSLASIAPSKLLTKKYVKNRVGESFFIHKNQMLKVKMTRILGDVEESNRLVVYESDHKYTWWTKLCIQQADCVLILVDSNDAPQRKRVEDCLAWAHEAKNVRIELVVVHAGVAPPAVSDNLNNWSEERPWITKHHHVRCSFADHTNDFHRMSRRITGQSIGLVMGGGGARGLAHLGIIKALNEVGLAVDMVGGTSQGAFVGALLARNPDDYNELATCVREMAKDMSSISNKLRDLTFPLTSFFSGHHFNRGIKKILQDVRIQDFILNFYCVSVDISNSRQMVHTKGLAWKYVRASMSLTGYLPPISEDNCLLVDGGYMNVVPADVMADMGAKKIIAVDVTKEEKNTFYDYGTELSGLWLLWNSWNPFVQTVKVPSMGDITERLSWVSAERNKNNIIENKVDLFLRPPVGHIGTLEYDKIDEVVKIGYDYAKPLVEKWAEENGH